MLTTAGGLYRYNISDLVRCVGYHGQAPMLEFLNKGAHYSSLTGEKISEHQVIAAVEAAQRAVAAARELVPACPDLGRPAVLRPPGRGGRPGRTPERSEALASAVERELRRQNVEYVCKRDSLRLGPVRILPIPNGSWAEFQRRRLVRSGGTVEQYKQPHLVPDLDTSPRSSAPWNR